MSLWAFREPVGFDLIRLRDVPLHEDATVVCVAELWLKQLNLAEPEVAIITSVARLWVSEARALRQRAQGKNVYIEWGDLTATALGRIGTELPSFTVPQSYVGILILE